VVCLVLPQDVGSEGAQPAFNRKLVGLLAELRLELVLVAVLIVLGLPLALSLMVEDGVLIAWSERLEEVAERRDELIGVQAHL